MNWLDNGEVLSAIGHFLAEDIGRGDITTAATVEPDVRGIGRFLAKEYLVICGIELPATKSTRKPASFGLVGAICTTSSATSRLKELSLKSKTR